MQPSYEARWFFEEAPPLLVEWLGWATRAELMEIPVRTDFYLPLEAKKNLNVKLREGNIEIKQRLKKVEKRNFGSFGLQGNVEYWVKWPFKVTAKDKLASAIKEENPYDWIAVSKERLLFIYEFEGAKKLPINRNSPEGCQVEFSEIIVHGKTYYTFALESFSELKREKQHFNWGADLVFAVLEEYENANKLPFTLENSMGYGAFLESIRAK